MKIAEEMNNDIFILIIDIKYKLKGSFLETANASKKKK